MRVDIWPGELTDEITILELKLERISDAEFVAVARRFTPDERSARKRAMNELLAGKTVEEKSYAAY